MQQTRQRELHHLYQVPTVAHRLDPKTGALQLRDQVFFGLVAQMTDSPIVHQIGSPQKRPHSPICIGHQDVTPPPQGLDTCHFRDCLIIIRQVLKHSDRADTREGPVFKGQLLSIAHNKRAPLSHTLFIGKASRLQHPHCRQICAHRLYPLLGRFNDSVARTSNTYVQIFERVRIL